jgi:hypothetical protein
MHLSYSCRSDKVAQSDLPLPIPYDRWWKSAKKAEFWRIVLNSVEFVCDEYPDVGDSNEESVIILMNFRVGARELFSGL